MKKTLTTITIAVLAIMFTTAPARADRKTMEGFLLGTGVTLLGAAIIHEINRDDKPAYQAAVYNSRQSCDRPVYKKHHPGKHRGWKKKHHRGPRGHWEVDRVWIDPVYERKWNPGHYNRRGEWVNGRYEKFKVASGYWKEERSWVRY